MRGVFMRKAAARGVLWASDLLLLCHVTLTWLQLMRPGLISDTKAACLTMTTGVLQ